MKHERHPLESLRSVFAALLLGAPKDWAESAVREKIHVVYRPSKAEAVEVGEVPGHMLKAAACERRHENPIRHGLAAWKMKV